MKEFSIYPVDFLKRGSFFILTVFLIFSCTDEFENPGTEETFWVYSYPIPCDYPSNSTSLPKPCLGITYQEEFDFELRTLIRIPFEIEGYTFKPYHIQKVKVQKTTEFKTGEEKRKLLEILEEERDYIDVLEGGWKVVRHLGEDLPNANYPDGHGVVIAPMIRSAVSSDGCNQISLEIRQVEMDKIISYKPGMVTLKACPPDWIKLLPFPGLNSKFKREGNILTFFSDEDEEVAIWEKIN